MHTDRQIAIRKCAGLRVFTRLPDKVRQRPPPQVASADSGDAMAKKVRALSNELGSKPSNPLFGGVVVGISGLESC